MTGAPNGFIPFLLALDSGMEVLVLTSSEWLYLSTTADTCNIWQRECAYHAVATPESGNLSCIPVYDGAIWPLINTNQRLRSWEAVHDVLAWQEDLAEENSTNKALGNNPTSRDPDRLVVAINLMADPEASKIVLNADFPEITVPGNMANQVMATRAFVDEVYTVKNPFTGLANKYYDVDFPFRDDPAAAWW
ncbi:hypothetical protein ASPZODRAFT_138325 [Penicilliopsis zonata CBS 506.65]|uniref:Uncharacterized protein n=1 Tax=Penicilliopsis zonata CBS 506.65 TaxID=1073090 RepID=A0A1L9SVK8_9EURO|nr:hypothetical protein ASPZODRAFT_138325 [Penicilliopsis zonata CBS 506.65]OJJ51218.1 hypothetical protein ASPZODRAFT_138325 [Penicilliopsis zonata CBS 506.65]